MIPLVCKTEESKGGTPEMVKQEQKTRHGRTYIIQLIQRYVDTFSPLCLLTAGIVLWVLSGCENKKSGMEVYEECEFKNSGMEMERR